jgi:hypothetical protein
MSTAASQPMLRIGDTVTWRGSWGSDPPRRAKVEQITATKERHMKYGTEVEELPWSAVERSIVSLDNGCWAYGYQLSR